MSFQLWHNLFLCARPRLSYKFKIEAICVPQIILCFLCHVKKTLYLVPEIIKPIRYAVTRRTYHLCHTIRCFAARNRYGVLPSPLTSFNKTRFPTAYPVPDIWSARAIGVAARNYVSRLSALSFPSSALSFKAFDRLSGARAAWVGVSVSVPRYSSIK